MTNSAKSKNYRIIFPDGYEGQWEEECAYKGWLANVRVAIAWGNTYSVTFVDMCRLRQMMDDEAQAGRVYLAEPGFVIVTEVSRENIELAVQGLVDERFFDALQP